MRRVYYNQKRVDAIKRDTKFSQAGILLAYGDKYIDERIDRLCTSCKQYRSGCLLIPVTTQGEDCQYANKL